MLPASGAPNLGFKCSNASTLPGLCIRFSVVDHPMSLAMRRSLQRPNQHICRQPVIFCVFVSRSLSACSGSFRGRSPPFPSRKSISLPYFVSNKTPEIRGGSEDQIPERESESVKPTVMTSQRSVNFPKAHLKRAQSSAEHSKKQLMRAVCCPTRPQKSHLHSSSSSSPDCS